ncbi:MAG: Panacea domain-containing protein [Candidatus Roizmanbacteria bacterium]|nr:Panacea domain-containing protein [Candidatus Roizmanbacteria bacterium]
MVKKNTTKTKMDKTTSGIIIYLISSLNGVLGKTHLQKLIFLADLLASKKFNKPITKMKYIRYTHGPYSQSLGEYVKCLVSGNFIEERRFPFISNPNKRYSRFYDKKKTDVKNFLVESIGAEKMLLIDEIVQSYGNKSLQQVLDFVYSLEEVKDAKFDSPIKLAKDIKVKDVEPTDEVPF